MGWASWLGVERAGSGLAYGGTAFGWALSSRFGDWRVGFAGGSGGMTGFVEGEEVSGSPKKVRAVWKFRHLEEHYNRNLNSQCLHGFYDTCGIEISMTTSGL